MTYIQDTIHKYESSTSSGCFWDPIEFSLNDFHWIQWIHWTITKSKNSMVTRNNTQLVTCTLPVAVIKITFPLLALVRYLLPFTPVNSCLTRCSLENLIFATASGNVSVVSCSVSLVTILLLDLLMFHWIQWIQWQSFRENSIVMQSCLTYFVNYPDVSTA